MGFVLFLLALAFLFWAFILIAAGGPGNVVAMILNGVLAIFVGLWCLGGAWPIADWAYPVEEAPKQPSPGNGTHETSCSGRTFFSMAGSSFRREIFKSYRVCKFSQNSGVVPR